LIGKSRFAPRGGLAAQNIFRKGTPELASPWNCGNCWLRSAARRRRGRLRRVRKVQIGGNKERQSDNYREQSHRCYPNDQKRQCGRVVVEPMFVHAHEDHSPCKNERVMNAALKGKQTLNLLLQPRHTWALSSS
jgi:hypothetical protein